jgi:hypothetical protein
MTPALTEFAVRRPVLQVNWSRIELERRTGSKAA